MNTEQRVVAMVDTGLLPAAIAAAFAEVFNVGDLDAEQMRYLNGPIVVQESPWNETRPEWMAQQVRAERLSILLQPNGLIIGPTEMACVLYGASLDSPIGQWSEVYVWATVHAMARWKRMPIDKAWLLIQEAPPAHDPVIQGRDGSTTLMLYRQLAHQVRRRVVARSEWRQVRTKARTPQDTTQETGYNTPIAQPITVEQFSLF